MNAPSVADEILFDALPELTKASIVRLYGGPPNGLAPSTDLLVRAYRAGFDAAVDEMSVLTPSCGNEEARRAVFNLRMAVKSPDMPVRKAGS